MNQLQQLNSTQLVIREGVAKFLETHELTETPYYANKVWLDLEEMLPIMTFIELSVGPHKKITLKVGYEKSEPIYAKELLQTCIANLEARGIDPWLSPKTGIAWEFMYWERRILFPAFVEMIVEMWKTELLKTLEE